MNYGMIAVMVLTFIVIFGIFGIFASIVYKEIPSEENCYRINGYGTQERIYAEQMYCEYNETGWHFNKTKFKEALGKMENWVT
jgi:hypothetical protein